MKKNHHKLSNIFQIAKGISYTQITQNTKIMICQIHGKLLKMHLLANSPTKPNPKPNCHDSLMILIGFIFIYFKCFWRFISCWLYKWWFFVFFCFCFFYSFLFLFFSASHLVGSWEPGGWKNILRCFFLEEQTSQSIDRALASCYNYVHTKTLYFDFISCKEVVPDWRACKSKKGRYASGIWFI